MSSSGGDVLKDVGNAVTKGFNDYIGALVGYDATDGSWGKRGFAGLAKGEGKYLFGYDSETGKWGERGLTQWFDEGVGEISGRNKARGAQAQAADQLASQQAQFQRDQDNKNAQNYRLDVAASLGAQGIRATSAYQSGDRSGAGNPQYRTDTLGAAQQDFLGL